MSSFIDPFFTSFFKGQTEKEKVEREREAHNERSKPSPFWEQKIRQIAILRN